MSAEQKASQQTKVLNYMRTHGSITAREALSFGCMRLASRITDLKKRGYIIDREMIEVTTADGGKARVARYTLWEPTE